MKSFQLETKDAGETLDKKAPSANDAKKGSVGAVISVIFLGAMIWYFCGGGLEQQAASTTNDIQKQVATDAVNQYNIAKRNGSAVDICVQAGMVTAAYLQAKDESSYQQWKKIQSADCARAGVPQ